MPRTESAITLADACAFDDDAWLESMSATLSAW
jgi:hypothetical protein